jgi:hypothetical protein
MSQRARITAIAILILAAFSGPTRAGQVSFEVPEPASGHARRAADQVWERIPPDPNRAPYLLVASAVYDAQRRRMLVFGGNANNPSSFAGEYKNDVWGFSLAGAPRWTRVDIPGPAPRPRGWASVVLDTRRNRMIVFGGRSAGEELLNDCWAWPLDGSTGWVRLDPKGEAPKARFGHTAIYDERQDRIIVFGGNEDRNPGTSPPLNDLWSLDLSGLGSWHELHPAGVQPPGRMWHAAVFDSRRDRMVLFGGLSPSQWDTADLWTLSLDGEPAWTQIEAQGAWPDPRSEASVTVDEEADQMLLFGGGGYFADTWRLSLSSLEWQVVTSETPGPAGRRNASAVFDPILDRLIVQGGDVDQISPSNQCWSLRLHPRIEWTQLSPPSPAEFPGPMIGAFAVDEDGTDGMLMFPNNGETWRLTSAEKPRWQALGLGGAPSEGRRRPAWEPWDDKVVGFDGYQVWSFDPRSGYETLLTLPSNEGPWNLNGGALIVDPVEHRLYVFGGGFPTAHLFDRPSNRLFSLALEPGAGWVEVVPASELPPAMLVVGGVYDARRRRLVVAGQVNCDNQGGCSGPTELWAFGLDGNRMWRRLATVPRLEPAPGPTMVIDAAEDRVLDFWGRDSSIVSYELESGDITQIRPIGPGPQRRFGAAVALDPRRREFIVYGGAALSHELLDDLWRVRLGGASPLPKAPGARLVTGGRIELTGGTAGPARLELFDVTGRRVGASTMAAGSSSAPIPGASTLPRGLYFIRATQDGASFVVKWVKT